MVATLQKLIEGGNYDDILQYTKESDAFFRKGKLGKARKLLTDEKLKGDSVLMSNAVSFCVDHVNYHGLEIVCPFWSHHRMISHAAC